MYTDFGVHTDWIVNGQGSAPLSQGLQQYEWNAGVYRPFIEDDGNTYVNWGGEAVPTTWLVNRKGIHLPQWNAASLRKDDWEKLDEAVIKSARQRLRAWADLAASSTYGGFDGMGKMVLEHEIMSDPGEAFTDMDGLTEGRTDSPAWKIKGLPLPITHSGFYFDARRLAISRSGRGQPLDLTMAEACGRRIGEKIEQMTIGTTVGDIYGGSYSPYTSQVYGYLTYPQRNTKSDLTTPTGANPDTTVAEVLEMRDTLYDDRMYGPYMLYHGTGWDQYMDNDYIRGTVAQGLAAPGKTLRTRIEEIENIRGVRRLDFLTGSNQFTMILVQMNSETARAVIGMGMKTIQWDTHGGQRSNFKTMTIMVPQVRSDFNDRCGLLVATVA